MRNKKILFYGGLPRSGSHLLSAILNQNPKIYSEGVSALIELMWINYEALMTEKINDRLSFFSRDNFSFKNKVINSIADCYYDGVEAELILDKNRSWTVPANIEMVKQSFDPNPKYIIMTRDIDEIVKSFVSLYMNNGVDQNSAEQMTLNLNEYGTNPLMRPIAATLWARVIADENFLFIDYEDIINDCENTLEKFYNFVDMPKFNHNLNNIENNFNEVVWAEGLSDVRPKISKVKRRIELSNAANEKISEIKEAFEWLDDLENNLDKINAFILNNTH